MTGISAAALRLYDRRGIFRPALVDHDTGYRYYSAAQLDSAELIHLLRKLDVPLAEIAQLLKAKEPPAVQEVLRRHEQRLKITLESVSSALKRLERALGPDRELLPYRVETGVEEPRLVVSTRAVARVSEIEVADYNESLAACVAALEAKLADRGIASLGREIVLHHNQTRFYEGLRMEVCLAVPMCARLQLEDAWILPGCTVARTRHLGSWTELWAAYASLLSWIERERYQATGPIRVRWLVDERDTSDSSRYVADFSVPIEPAD